MRWISKLVAWIKALFGGRPPGEPVKRQVLRPLAPRHGRTRKPNPKGCFGAKGLTAEERRLSRTRWKRSRLHHETYAQWHRRKTWKAVWER